MLQYFETLTDDSGNSLSGATVVVTNYPSGSLASIYSTNGTASPIASSKVTADVTGQVSFYAPDGAYTLTYSWNATVYKTKSPVQMLDPMGLVVATDIGAANAYVVTDSRFPASLYTNLRSTFTALHTNAAGASTYNLNATGNQPLVQADGSNPPAGVIVAAGTYEVIWTGSAWQMMNDIVLSATIVGALLYPIVAAELSTVTSTKYPYGDLRRYGAVGGGVTDDSVAWQSALTVSGLFPVIIPFIAGGFLINTPGVAPANCTIIGNDYPLLFSTVAGSHILSSTGNAGLTIRGVNFAGLNSSTVPLTGFGGFAAANTGLVTASNCTDVRITDCGFSTFYNGVTAQGCNRVWINERNRIQHWLTIGVLGSQSSNIWIDNNIFDTCDQAGGVVAYACNVTGNQAGGFPSQNVSFCDNRIFNVPSWDIFGSHDVDGLKACRNIGRNCRHGIDVGPLVYTNVVQNIEISDNDIEGPTTDTWGGANAEIGGVICEGLIGAWTGNLTIAGTALTINSTSTGTFAIGQVVVCAGILPNTVVVSGSGTAWVVSLSQAVGPVAASTNVNVHGAMIAKNKVKNFFNVAGMVGGGLGAACIVVAATDDANVIGNTIWNSGLLSGGSVIPQSTGMYFTGTCARLNIMGNTVQGNTFNRGGVRTNALISDVLTIVGNGGQYVTASTPHVNHINGNIGVLNVSSNPTNSTVPYLESGSTCTNSSNYQLAGSGNAATAVSNNSVIPTAFGFVQCTVAGASTGNILTAGIAPGQEVVVINASGANSITMAVSGTSNVADGVACVIAANSYKRFVWNAATSLWYHS